jgi:hypothetical protein
VGWSRKSTTGRRFWESGLALNLRIIRDFTAFMIGASNTYSCVGDFNQSLTGLPVSIDLLAANVTFSVFNPSEYGHFIFEGPFCWTASMNAKSSMLNISDDSKKRCL